MLTYAQIKTRVIDIVRPGSGTTYATQCLQACNFAQKRMAEMYDFRELCLLDKTTLDTEASTKVITMWAAVKTIFGIAIEDTTETRWLKLFYRDQIDPAYPYPEGDAEGKPTIGLIWDAVDASNIPCLKVELIPVPDAIYDVYVRYGGWPTDFLDSGTEYSDYKNKDDIIIAGACAEWYMWDRKYEDTTFWESMFNKKMKEAIKRDKKHNQYDQIQPFTVNSDVPSQYWAMPFYKRQPR